MELFNNERTNSFFNKKNHELNVDIENISDQDILNLDKEEFKNYYYNKYYIEPINILDDQITNDIEKTQIEKLRIVWIWRTKNIFSRWI